MTVDMLDKCLRKKCKSLTNKGRHSAADGIDIPLTPGILGHGVVGLSDTRVATMTAWTFVVGSIPLMPERVRPLQTIATDSGA